jgi:uncharacterized protein
MRPFARCLRCNTPLEEARPEDVRDRVPPRAAQWYREFRSCPGCGRAYWKGGHYERMRSLVDAAGLY